MGRGLLIAIEGIDGAGTTTQSARLAEALRREELEVYETREPSRGPVGQLLRQFLGETDRPIDPTAMALLFAADRMDHVDREIRPALERGVHVVTDRYLLSSLAYQSITIPRARVAAFNADAPAADLTVLVEASPAVAAKRRLGRGGPVELYDADAMQARVASAYRTEAEALLAAGHNVRIIDGSADVETVFATLRATVRGALGI